MNILLFQNRAIGLRFTESLFFDSFENIIKIRKPILSLIYLFVGGNII